VLHTTLPRIALVQSMLQEDICILDFALPTRDTRIPLATMDTRRWAEVPHFGSCGRCYHPLRLRDVDVRFQSEEL